NTIGGAATGAGNLIAFNGDNPVFIAQEDKGVFVVDGTGNAIRGNSIHNNVGLGIDLSSDAVITLNDGLDADAGANNLQNFPDLTSASSSGGSTTVQGRFNSAPNATFTIDFYSNTTCNPSTGYGEGQTFIGTASVTTNNRGTMTFSATLPFDTTGQVITSTATDAANNTSEFSGCLAVGALTEIQVTTTDDNGSDGAPTPGSLRAAIRNSNNLGGLKAITFNIPASDPNCNAATNVCTITPPTALQNITAPVIIDGWSQGGANYNGPPLIQLNSSMTINAGSSTVQGLVIPSGITLETFGGNTIRGNYIGTDASGLNRVGNVNGIIINTPENVIGGTNTAHRNIISGSSANGIIIQTLQARGNVIQGNYIGTDKNGANPGNTMGNVNTGILIRISASENIIGGTAAGAGNLIAFNGIGSDAGGILVFSSAGTGNTIRGNSIRDNFGLGIELLGNFGITANDAGDADTGANNLQNFPIITNASTSSGSATISGTLNSLADTQYAIDFYSSLSCDASGNGEGTTYLGSATVTTDNAGNANFNATLPIAPGTQTITSTATLISTGDTSEFSACRTINAPTAATAPLGGQIISEFGQVAKGIVVKLLRISDGTVRETVTNTRGFYLFDDIVTGDTYIITPTRRGFRFLPDNVVYSHVEERFDINFTAVRQRSTSNAISQDD
ncbi:MAG TPA: carboxypeptidase-like regulatory domain-containing protein, partial [Pyrinomonadaceae bacterium]|nr:carboxypeptidase-like regulatory domain-containing protein [Pyrinomonadaceae bacterium]